MMIDSLPVLYQVSLQLLHPACTSGHSLAQNLLNVSVRFWTRHPKQATQGRVAMLRSGSWHEFHQFEVVSPKRRIKYHSFNLVLLFVIFYLNYLKVRKQVKYSCQRIEMLKIISLRGGVCCVLQTCSCFFPDFSNLGNTSCHHLRAAVSHF